MREFVLNQHYSTAGLFLRQSRREVNCRYLSGYINPNWSLLTTVLLSICRNYFLTICWHDVLVIISSPSLP